MTQTIGIGVVGMGWMGMVHSRSYRQVGDRFRDSGIQPRLIICADNVEARAQEARQILGFENYTTDWREVVANPAVDVVNIAAPNYLHLEMVREAARGGKHIFCEKPVGKSPEETAEIENLARKAGVQTFVGFNYRWAPLVQYGHQLLQQGKMGTVTHFWGRFFSMYGSNPYGLLTWRFESESAGMGVLGDIMSHVADMAHFLVGPIKRTVSTRHTYIEERPLPIPGKGTHYSMGEPGDPMGGVTNEDYVSALVDFKNGAKGTLEVCRTFSGPKSQMAFELTGTRGAFNWDFERMNELEIYLPEETGLHDGFARLVAGPEHPFHGRINPGAGVGIGYEDLKVIEAYQFLQSIVDGEQRPPGFAEALALAEVQAAMIRSWDSGHWEEVSSLRQD